jgi:hypothetical protein
MAAAANFGAAQEMDLNVPDHRTGFEISRRAGPQALVGFEFFIRDGREGVQRRVRVERLNADGQTYRVVDLKAKVELAKDMLPMELSVGHATRSEDDPVIRLLRQVKILAQPFLDPALARSASAVGEFRTPTSRLDTYEALRRSAPPILLPEVRGPTRLIFNPGTEGMFRMGTPSPRREVGHAGRMTPFPGVAGGFGPFRPNMHATRPVPMVPDRPLGERLRERFGDLSGQYEGQRRRLGGTFQQAERQGGMNEETFERADRNWDPQRGRAEHQQRQNLGEAEFQFGRPYEQRKEMPFNPPEARRTPLRGRTWVRVGEDEFQPEEREDWQRGGEWGPRSAGEGRARWANEGREGNRQGRMEGPEDDRMGEWEPRGRHELRAIRENEKDRRARSQRHEDEGSGVTHDQEKGEEACKKKGTNGSLLESRIDALERDRRYEKARAGLSTELRRLQSGVSPFEHPGLYSHIDQMVTLHEAPITHRGPMAVAGATGDILKVPHIKLSYLAEALWEFTRRKCAEGGEHLSDQHILEIEAQVLEQFGKQRVEAGKILDKAGLSGRGR